MSYPRARRAPDDPLQQLSASAAVEIVKAARASLKEPSRPITPAEGRRQLLQSDCYASRPQTAGGPLSSRAFLGNGDASLTGGPSGAADESCTTFPWSSGSSNSVTADVWSAESDTSTYRSSSQQPPGQNLRPSSALPTSSALRPTSALRPSTATTAGALAPLRPGSASLAADVALKKSVSGSNRSTAAVGSYTIPVSNLAIGSTADGPATSVLGSTFQDTTIAAAIAAGPATSAAEPGAEASFSSSRSSSRGSSRGASRDSSRAASASSQHTGADAKVPTAVAALTWHQQVLKAVQLLNSMPVNPSAADAAALLHACAGLQTLLDTAEDQKQLQGWLDALLQDSAAAAVLAGKPLRPAVVACLVRLVDCPKADVLVKVGSMLLRAIPLQSSRMVTASKMLYKLSKDSSNDARFRHHGVLRPLLSVITQSSKPTCYSCCRQQQQPVHGDSCSQLQKQPDSMVLLYLAGCLKNLSADASNQKALGRLGAVQTMTGVIMDQVARTQQVQQQRQRIRHQQQSPQEGPETAIQICVQATAVLRNLAIPQGHVQLFVDQQGSAIAALLDLLAAFSHEEVIMNVSRCLSKLSMHSQCRESISRHVLGHKAATCCQCGSKLVDDDLGHSVTAVEQLTQLMLQLHAGASNHWAVVLRLAFVLGNLTMYDSEARQQMAALPGAMDSLLQLALELLQELRQSEPQQQQGVPALAASASSNNKGSSNNKPVEDLLVKLLRLLGNVAIDSSAGPQLAAQQAAVDAVMGVLCCCSYETQEELVLNAAAAVTNLAFYNQQTNKFLQLDAVALLQPLLPLLTSSNEEAAIEAARAISNLARGSEAVRSELLHHSQQSPGDSVYEELTTDNPEQQQGLPPTGSPRTDALDAGSASSEDGGSSGATEAAVGPYVLQALVLLLCHSSWEVVSSVAGALLNLTAVEGSGPALLQVGLADELQESLQRAAAELRACIQDSCTPGGDAPAQQQPLAPPGEMLEAMGVMLQCVSNITSSRYAAPEPAQALVAAYAGEIQQPAAVSRMHGILQQFKGVLVDLSEASRSDDLMLPGTLQTLIGVLQERSTRH